jgi:hypothetical protein
MSSTELTKLKEQVRYLKLKQRNKAGATLMRLKKQIKNLRKHPENANANR